MTLLTGRMCKDWTLQPLGSLGRSPDAVQPKHVGPAPALQPSSRIPHGGRKGCPVGLTNIFCGIPIASDVPIGALAIQPGGRP